ncbi:hypothetical protein pb186bvf_012863 [Paramecium bursaria]
MMIFNFTKFQQILYSLYLKQLFIKIQVHLLSELSVLVIILLINIQNRKYFQNFNNKIADFLLIRIDYYLELYFKLKKNKLQSITNEFDQQFGMMILLQLCKEQFQFFQLFLSYLSHQIPNHQFFLIQQTQCIFFSIFLMVQLEKRLGIFKT